MSISHPKRPLPSTTAKIKTGQLLTRLQNHTLGKLKVPMTASQIRAAEILLARTLPTLQAMQVQTQVENEITIKWK